MPDLNGLDIIILVIVALNLGIGFQKGMIRIAFEIIGFLGGIFLGIRFAPDVAEPINMFLPVGQPYTGFIGFIFIWLAVFWITTTLAKALDKALRFSVFNIFNRLIGACLGTVRGMLIVIPFLMPMVFFNVSWTEHSSVVQPMRPLLLSIIEEFTGEKIEDPAKDVLPQGEFEGSNGADPAIDKVKESLKKIDWEKAKKTLKGDPLTGTASE